MNIKNTFFAVLLGLGCFATSAQAQESEYEFKPYWGVQAQFGGQHTLGEVDFSDLCSWNAQVGVSYQFHKVFGARFSVNAWQSKGGSDFNLIEVYKNAQNQTITKVDPQHPRWSWNYVAPMVDLTASLSNAIWGYNPNRLFDLGVFLGVGANVAFNNDEATEVYNHYLNNNILEKDQFLRYYWTGTKCRLTGRAGVTGDFRINQNLSLGLELNANILSDRYNNKKAGDKSVDWYFNALVGVKYTFGKSAAKLTKKATTPYVDPNYQPEIREKIVEKPVEKIVEKKVVIREPLREDIFFLICGSEISNIEMVKVQKVIDYMKKYPDAKVTVTGYADKGTGNPTLNMGYAQKRADVVAETLKKFGVPADRMVVTSKGDTEQPYGDKENKELNRVTICIAE